MYVLIAGVGLVGINLAQKLPNIDSNACLYAGEQAGAIAFPGSRAKNFG